MLNFKLRKGEIATLLTLGLVLVGTLITLGTSFFVNKTKIASNPKAQCAGTVPNPDKACCFCKKGNVIVYATAQARVNNCMGTPCTTAAYGSAYGASSWGYCDSPGGGNYQGGACTGVGGGTPVPGATLTPEDCKNTTCKAENFGLSSDPISYYENKPDIFYFELNCGGDKHTDIEIKNAEYCGNTSGACNEIQCKQWKAQLKSLPGYNEDFMNNNSVWKKLGSEQLYTDYPCSDDLTTTYQTACMPPASGTHTCDVEVQCADILGEKYTGKLYQFSDEQGPGENYYKTKSCLRVADPDEDCEKVTGPPPTSSFTCPGTETFVSGGQTYTSCFTRDLHQTYQPGGVLGDFNDIFKPQCNTCGGFSGIGGTINDTGYCCNPTPK